MAKPLQTVTIQAPGFYGLNTQDSPTNLVEQFALEADNCVIDRYGRVGARKGWYYLNSTPTESDVVYMSEYVKADTSSEIISITKDKGDGVIFGKIYKGTTTLTEITPSGYSVGDGRFRAVTMNDTHYLFKAGYAPLYYNGTTCDLIANHPDYSGTVPQGGIPLASFGRLWVANGNIVYWSDLLIGAGWSGGSSGSINMDKVWADGEDTITGLASHNGFLIIFGMRQIVMYQGAEDPATMSLADTVVGVGCIDTDTIQPTGNDLFFVSDDGVGSLNRTVQEKSIPLRDISRNIRNEIMAVVRTETGQINSVFYPEDQHYLINFEDTGIMYCFDTTTTLEDGSYRVTRWQQLNPRAMLRTREGKLYFGKEEGVALYDGYRDNGSPYFFKYFSNYLDFGTPSQLKLLKNLKVSIIGGSETQCVLNWGYDYSYDYRKKIFILDAQTIAEYGIAEYNIGEFNAGVLVNRPSVNASGGGAVVQIGIEAQIDGSPLSVQRMTAQSIIGRVI